MSVIDDYLAELPKAERKELERLRKLIRSTVPDAQEVITYGMPGFKYKNKYLASFAVFADHLSYFPGALPEDVSSKLKNFKISKGTIQFTLEHTIPDDIVVELLTRRVAAIDHNA